MADFASQYAKFQAADIDVVAASVDDIVDAKKMIAEGKVPFPVAYGLDAVEVAATLGGFYEPDPEGAFLHPADFIVAPDRRILSSTYSTAAVGRLEPGDALGFITYKRDNPG